MRREKSTTKLTLAATGAMLLVGALAGAGIHYAGTELLFIPGPAKASAAEAEAAAMLEMRTTPAESALTSALENGPAGWNATGGIQTSEAAPPPYSCPLPGKAPAAAISRTFDTSGTSVKVTLTAYTAGLGAEAMGELNAAFERCAGPAAFPGWDHMYGQKPGAEAYLASVNRSGNAYRTASFRRGDVIAYVSGSADFGMLQSLSLAVDNHLAAHVDPVCKDAASTAEQSERSLWATAAYNPFRVSADVKITDPGLPAVTGKEAPVKVSLPGPVLEFSEALPVPVPEYPVWPLMPQPVPLPQEPQSPAPAPVLASKIRTLALDTSGPGCGWAFTATSAPVFDAAAAEKNNRAARTAASSKLTAGAKAWSSEVLQYWKDYGAFAKEVKAYTAYSAKVKEVNEAWNAIAADWTDYYTRAANYDLAVSQKEDFVLRHAAAEQEYEARIKECASRPEPTPSPTPEPSPEPTPSPTASPSPTATPEPEPSPEPCDTSRPAILDEEEPEIPAKPVEPADPRPKDKR